MEELLSALGQFRQCLEQQANLFEELLSLMDEEESFVSHFALADFERIVVDKDCIVRRISATEERRLALLKKICFFISFDLRAGLPGLKSLGPILDAYVANVRSLLAPDVVERLGEICGELRCVSHRYLELFTRFAPRVYRNQQVMRKMAQNFSRSLALLECETTGSQNYDATGKRHALVGSVHPYSSVRVKA